jgi:hypothetical protein
VDGLKLSTPIVGWLMFSILQCFPVLLRTFGLDLTDIAIEDRSVDQICNDLSSITWITITLCTRRPDEMSSCPRSNYSDALERRTMHS